MRMIFLTIWGMRIVLEAEGASTRRSSIGCGQVIHLDTDSKPGIHRLESSFIHDWPWSVNRMYFLSKSINQSSSLVRNLFLKKRFALNRWLITSASDSFDVVSVLFCGFVVVADSFVWNVSSRLSHTRRCYRKQLKVVCELCLASHRLKHWETFNQRNHSKFHRNLPFSLVDNRRQNPKKQKQNINSMK